MILGAGWGNGEAECYTSSNKNAYVTSDGVLNIQVLKVADTTPCANARVSHGAHMARWLITMLMY